MKLGLIADVHGDYAALTTALNRLEQYHGVDSILCAGDLIGRGPQPEQVVRLMQQRGIACVKGNHDEWAYNMSPEAMVYLDALPINWRSDFGGCQVFMCHGKPGNNIWGLYRDHVSDTLLNMMLGSLGVHVLVVGHTHVPMCIRVKNGIVVNPGSLYTFNSMRSTSHSYGVLHLDDYRFDVFDLTRESAEPISL